MALFRIKRVEKRIPGPVFGDHVNVLVEDRDNPEFMEVVIVPSPTPGDETAWLTEVFCTAGTFPFSPNDAGISCP